MSRRVRLGESLVESGLITPGQLDEALRRGNTTGERIGEALVGLGYISERDLLRTLANDADIPFLEPRELVVDPMVAGAVSATVARAEHVVPLRVEGRSLVVAMGNPFDVGVIRSLERSTGRPVRVQAADPAAIAQLVETVYGRGAHTQTGASAGAEHAARARSTWTQNAPATGTRQAPAPAAATASAQLTGSEDA